MTKSDCISRLIQIGISYNDALALRRIAMTLHRWHELECGDSNNDSSWCISRGHLIDGDFKYDDNGDAYMEVSGHSGNNRYHRIPDRETGAKKRLAQIMQSYPTMQSYIQGDPRGASLYILPPNVTAENYNHGIAVYK
jgi:hypothetical protein